MFNVQRLLSLDFFAPSKLDADATDAADVLLPAPGERRTACAKR
jgi:hypothetical protein